MTVRITYTVWCDNDASQHGMGGHGFKAIRATTPEGARAEAAKKGWAQRPPLGGTTIVRDICPRHK